MSAEAQVRCNAEYGEVDADRINSRNGAPANRRALTIDLAAPKLRHGSYFPTGSSGGAAAPSSPSRPSSRRATSTRRVEKLCEAMGITCFLVSQAPRWQEPR